MSDVEPGHPSTDSLIGPPAVLNFTCLSVFWRPKTPENRLDLSLASALVESGDWESADRAYKSLFTDMFRRTDKWSVLNFSAILHEIRHFHDLMLTSWGNQTFAASFDAVLSNLRLLRALRRSGVNEVLEPPILPGDFPELDEFVADARAAVAAKHKIQRTGETVLELLAYYVQAFFVWSTVPNEPTFDNYQDMLESQNQHGMAAALTEWAEVWKAPQWEWNETCFRFLVGCLDGAACPDAEFAKICRSVNPKAMNWWRAKKEFDNTILPNLEQGAANHRLRFVQWLQTIENKIMSDELLEEEDRRVLIHLLDIFFSMKMQMLTILDSDPGRFSSLEKYVTSMSEISGPRLKMPRIYCYYPDNRAYVREGLPTYSTDDFFHLRAHAVAPPAVLRRLARQRGGVGLVECSLSAPPSDGRSATEVFLHPVPNPFAGADDLMPTPWGAFARDLAGCVALTEGRSPIDPVLRHWMEVMARRHALKFLPRN
jgi:hypothetical protein